MRRLPILAEMLCLAVLLTLPCLLGGCAGTGGVDSFAGVGDEFRELKRQEEIMNRTWGHQ